MHRSSGNRVKTVSHVFFDVFDFWPSTKVNIEAPLLIFGFVLLIRVILGSSLCTFYISHTSLHDKRDHSYQHWRLPIIISTRNWYKVILTWSDVNTCRPGVISSRERAEAGEPPTLKHPPIALLASPVYGSPPATPHFPDVASCFLPSFQLAAASSNSSPVSSFSLFQTPSSTY